MSITPLPPYDAPFIPVPQVTPFTYRDGVTMLKKLEDLKRYINRVLVPFVNDSTSDLAQAFEDQVNLLIIAVNNAIEQVINSSIEVQDPVVAALIGDLDSDTSNALDLRYALKSVVDSIQTIIDSGRLSDASLDAAYGAKSDVDQLLTDVSDLETLTTTGRLGQPDLDARYLRKKNDVLNVADYADLKAAINALPASGGTIVVPIGRFYVGDWTQLVPMTKANVRIVGEKMPTFSANADRLQNGSVLYGRFNVFADNFEIDNVGIDFGKYVCDTFYSGDDQATADHPLGGGWDAFAFAVPDQVTPTSVTGLNIGRIIGLLRSPASYGHAVLIEGAKRGSVRQAVGVGGIHGVAFKSRNIEVGALHGYAASSNHVIIKADNYASCGESHISSIVTDKTVPGTTPWWALVDASNGININAQTDSLASPILVDSASVKGCDNGLSFTGQSAYSIDGVRFGKIEINGFGATMDSGINYSTTHIYRISIEDAVIANCGTFIVWNGAFASDANSDGLWIGNLYAVNGTVNGISISGTAYVVIDHIDMNNCPYAYDISATSRLMVGRARLTTIGTAVFKNNAPVKAANYSDFGSGNQPFRVILENYGVTVEGLITAAAGAGGTMSTLPAYLRPTASRRYPGYINVGGTRTFALLGVDAASGTITLNDGAAPAAGNYISLDGIHFPLL